MNVLEKDSAWKVFFGCGFGNHRGRDRSGTEMRINKQFEWYDALWHIPAVYVCSAGLVIDICIQIAPEKIKAFYDKWEWAAKDEKKLTIEEIEQIDAEDPMRKYYSFEVQINNRNLRQRTGCSMRWIPESCGLEELGQHNEEEWEAILTHYQLDPSKGWLIHRHSLPWDYKRKPVIKSLKLHLEQQPVPIIGKKFVTQCMDTENNESISVTQCTDIENNENISEAQCSSAENKAGISVTHPITGQVHIVTIKSIEKQELDVQGNKGRALAKREEAGAEESRAVNTMRKMQEAYEFPSHFYRMDYTLEPDLPGSEFFIGDCRQSDPPKRKMLSGDKASDVQSASSIGIIGGADGPTAIFLAGASQGEQLHAACSALRFEPADEVEWKMVFQVKMFEDVEVEIV